MRNSFLILSLCFFFHTTVKAQLPDGSIAPDFTLTDINGNEFSLYEDALNQGKFVVIDFFATWCPPCWSGFNQGYLENQYQWYNYEANCGNGLTVIGIESDLTTSYNDLIGTGSNTQGNYLDLASFPIFDVTTSYVPDLFEVNSYPTYYIIAPTGETYASNYYSHTELLGAAGDFLFPYDVSAWGVSETDCNLNTYTPEISFFNSSSLTLYNLEIVYSFDGGPEMVSNWNGTLVSQDFGYHILPTYNFPQGTHEIQYFIRNPNGQEDINYLNNCGKFTFSINNPTPFVEFHEDFNDGELPEPWGFVNIFNNIHWEHSPVNGGCILIPCFEDFDDDDNNIDAWTPHINLTMAEEAFLQFDYAYARNPGHTDGLIVEVRSACQDSVVFYKYGFHLSTAPEHTTNFVPLANEWETFCFDLQDFLGQTIWIWFEADYDRGNNIYIDNVRVTQNNCTISVDELALTDEFNIYPNPTSGSLIVELRKDLDMPESVKIINGQGQLIDEIKGNQIAGKHMQIDTNFLTNGLYHLVIQFDTYSESKIFMVSK